MVWCWYVLHGQSQRHFQPRNCVHRIYLYQWWNLYLWWKHHIYTVIIPPNRYGVDTVFQITGKNLEYLEKDNTLLKVKENHSVLGESDFRLESFLNYGFEIGWTGMRDGYWVEYQYSNDGGITWSKAVRAEVKQSYYVTVNTHHTRVTNPSLALSLLHLMSWLSEKSTPLLWNSTASLRRHCPAIKSVK